MSWLKQLFGKPAKNAVQKESSELSVHSVCETPGGGGSSIKSASAAMQLLLDEALPVLRPVTEDVIKGFLEYCRMEDLCRSSCLPEEEARTKILHELTSTERRDDFLWFNVSVRPVYELAEVCAVRDQANRRTRLIVWKCSNGLLYATSDYLEAEWSCSQCKGMSTIFCGGDKNVPWSDIVQYAAKTKQTQLVK